MLLYILNGHLWRFHELWKRKQSCYQDKDKQSRKQTETSTEDYWRYSIQL